MADVVQLNEIPQAEHMYMILGWRQWADGGAISSGLPRWLAQENNARKIGSMSPDGFYLFQIPGTHDLVRPEVKFTHGYPETLEDRRNDFYYTGNDERGVVIFIGDEPHLDIERYSAALLDTAQKLKVERIISLGGVYGELPYNKERMVSGIYSLPKLKNELEQLAVTLSDYEGGASMGSYICRRAADRNMEFVGFYAFVPTYDFSNVTQIGNSIRIENDFMAWHTVMRRINYMLKTEFDLTELEEKSEKLIEAIEAKIDHLESLAPEINVRLYMEQLADAFEEIQFEEPLANVWEDELRRLFDADDEEE
ncbi:MAG: PAC2 family protein [Anaerolineae bacterium]|nr:PAC2 family protein [Anaerolineae bacterium]